MRMSQYVYFSLTSETLTARAIAAELGMEPDRTVTRNITLDELRKVFPGY